MANNNVIMLVVIVGVLLFLLSGNADSINLNPGMPDTPPDNDSSVEDPGEGSDSVCSLSIGNSCDTANSVEESLYNEWRSAYVKDNGAVISNHIDVPWCPNSCIGCDDTRTSEGVCRGLYGAYLQGDRDTFALLDSYVQDVLQRSSGRLAWQINADGSIGSCGGQNTATDGDLKCASAYLSAAKDGWGNDYKAKGLEIGDGLKASLLSGDLLPDCVLNDNGVPCTDKVFTGYLNVEAMDLLCEQDSDWCGIRSANKELLERANKDSTVYTSYRSDSDSFGTENLFVHQVWAVKHGVCGNVPGYQELYDESRNVFFSQDRKICQQFDPNSGCKVTNPPIWIYTNYLEMANCEGDDEFASALRNIIEEKMQNSFWNGQEISPFCGPDNFAQVSCLEGLGEERTGRIG